MTLGSPIQKRRAIVIARRIDVPLEQIWIGRVRRAESRNAVEGLRAGSCKEIIERLPLWRRVTINDLPIRCL